MKGDMYMFYVNIYIMNVSFSMVICNWSIMFFFSSYYVGYEKVTHLQASC
jgi:hypothetical protein